MARHPWELTLREFVEKARRDYGIEIELAAAAVVSSWLLRREDRIFPIPVADPDEVMPPSKLAALAKLYGMPVADFGLDPSEEEG